MAFRLISLSVVALVVLAIGVVGLMLLRRGWRGRRVGDHPVCRKCGFDLFGLPEGRAICPECGGDLTAQGAVLSGHRQRRPGLIWTGAAMILLFALIAGVIGNGVARHVDWQRVKPAAWLAWEARGGSATAWKELTRRLMIGGFSKDRAQALADNALAWQKDLTRRWEPAVGDFVEAARGAKLITDEQWTRYATQAPQLSLRFRAKVRKGDQLPGDIVFGPARVGSQSKLSLRIEKPLDVDDPLVVPPREDGGSGYFQTSLGGTGTSAIYFRLEPKAVEAAPLGKRTMKVKISAELRESWDAPGIEWKQELSGGWELVGAEEQTVEIVADNSPAVRKQVEAALKLDKLEVRPTSGSSAGTNVSLDLNIAALPVPLSYDVLLRSGDREWKLTSIAVAGPTHYGTGRYFQEKDKFDARRVDIVFRPSPEAAHNSVNITRMWNGEVVIRDVEVKWPATQPATAPR